MSVSSAGSTDAVQLIMLKKQMSTEATQSAQLLEGLRAQAPAAAAPPARPTPPPGTYYL